MVSINTSDDLIRAIRENPEFRATVRRELLTEELLEVPARLQALTTTVEGLAATVGELQATVRDLQATVRGLAVTVEHLGNTTAELRGDVLDSKLTNKIPPLIAREFDVRRVYPIWTDGLLPINPRIEEFERAIEEASDNLAITDDDETRLRVTDLLVRAQRKSDRSTLWFAVEASGSIDDGDITRARHSADVLRTIFGQDAMPLVYGYQVSGRSRELANELQVPVFLDAD